MSYLISLAAIKQPNGTYKCGYIGSFGGMRWRVGHPDAMPNTPEYKEYIKELNKSVINHLSSEDTSKYYITTEEKLKVAPIDECIIITGEDTWEDLKFGKRVNNITQRPLQEFLKIEP